MGTVLAACIVHELRRDSGMVGVTGIDKRAVEGRVKVGRYGLRADVQADRKYHGGLEQAVYLYSQEDADFWSAQLGRELAPGWFGENLRVDGIEVSAAVVGTRWVLGDSGLELEVTRSRTPCMTFARWVGGADARGWVKRFADAGRLGVYARVVRNGTVGAGDVIEQTSVPVGAPTARELLGLAS